MMTFEEALKARFLLQKEYLGDDKPINRTTPLVSISVATYQHKNYIRQCLDGILMQKTNFPFEVIIGEDGSVDGTQEISIEYAEKYPDKIRLFIRDRNLSQFKDEDGRVKRFNGIWNRMSCRGKYIAMCEGDDYWIDPLKLQKQVDFLEANPDYSMCFHEADILNETNNPFKYRSLENREYDSNELFIEWIVPTASIVILKDVILNMESDNRIINGDIDLVLSAANIGKVYGMHEVMSVYRVHNGGLTISRVKTDNLNLQLGYIEHYNALREKYKKVSDCNYNLKISDSYFNLSLIYVRKRNLKRSFISFCKSVKYNKYRFIVRIFNKLVK